MVSDDSQPHHHIAPRCEPAFNEALLRSIVIAAVDEFYEGVANDAALRSRFDDEASLLRARRRQVDHWLQVFEGAAGPGYDIRVRTIVIQHAKIGLPPSFFLSSYSSILMGVIKRLNHAAAPPNFTALLMERAIIDIGAIADTYVALEQFTSRAKSHFISEMSHELRTALNAIIGYAEMLREGAGRDIATANDLDTIVESARRMMGLLKQLLEIARGEDGAGVCYRELIDPVALARGVMETLTPFAAKYGAALDLTADAGVLVLEAEHAKLRQCLLSLLASAIRSARDGQVSLAIRQDEARVLFEVRDSGPGLSPEQLTRLLNPFSHVDPHAISDGGGVGLGLVIVKQLAEAMGGGLSAASTSGAGGAITLWLPPEAPTAKPDWAH